MGMRARSGATRTRPWPRIARWAPLSAFLAVGCDATFSFGDGAPVVPLGEPATSRFAVGRAEDFDDDKWFDHPWPSDLRRDGLGPIRLDGWPNPRRSALIRSWLDQIRGQIDGFSPAAAGYLAWSAAIDETTLPRDPRSTLSRDASLQLVDVDPGSPTRGARHPIEIRYRDGIGTYYLVPHVVTWAPILGRPLRPRTRYAIVATRAIVDRTGAPVSPSADLERVLAGIGDLGRAWSDAIASLEQAGIARDRIAHLSIFTTGDPLDELARVAEDARTATPILRSIEAGAVAEDFDRYVGVYDGSPSYQLGAPPFLESGGGFAFDAGGRPSVQRTESLRFQLTVPRAGRCAEPTGGFPIVLFSHGTGGDFGDLVDSGTAAALARECLAAIGVDQIFHGTRAGAPPLEDPARDTKISLAFFNLSNAVAARTNARQAAIDDLVRARLISTGALRVPPTVSRTGREIRFDPRAIGFFGHSQGGLDGPLALAVDDQLKGAVLSGAGSAIAWSLLEKTKPEPSVAGLVRAFVGVETEHEDELGPLHPALALVQTLVDPADPVHAYAAFLRLSRREPKSLLLTEGVRPDGSGDSYSPPRTIEASAIAGGCPIARPIVRDLAELAVEGIAPVDLPVRGNVAAGRATCALLQAEPPPGRDGHFVAFDVPALRATTASFLGSLLRDPVPTIPALRP
jgi:hypothetical protein